MLEDFKKLDDAKRAAAAGAEIKKKLDAKEAAAKAKSKKKGRGQKPVRKAPSNSGEKYVFTVSIII